MDKVRIAVAGAGYIGRAHMDAALASSSVQLAAIVDPLPSVASLATQHGIPHYASLAELFANEDTASHYGVILATPNSLHLAHAITCMDAGVPCLLEKPITPTVLEAEALLAHQAKTGATMLIGHHRAHSPIMAAARAVIDSGKLGKLGKLVAVMGSALFVKPDHYFEDSPWRRQAGGGPILINMIHEVHNLRMLCGEITQVQALTSHAGRGFAVEDTVAINLRFSNGALGIFLLSDCAASARSWEQTSRENATYPSYDDEDCYVISGTHGSLSIPTMHMKSYAQDEDRSWWKPFEVSTVAAQRSDPIAHQMEHFAKVVRGEAAPLVSAFDGMQNLLITEAIVQSAKTGQVIQTG
jgi:predicted dehydrogenase